MGRGCELQTNIVLRADIPELLVVELGPMVCDEGVGYTEPVNDGVFDEVRGIGLGDMFQSLGLHPFCEIPNIENGHSEAISVSASAGKRGMGFVL